MLIKLLSPAGSLPSRPYARHAALALALGLGAALMTPGYSAEPEFVGVLALAVQDETAAALELTDDQLARLTEIIDDREQEALELALQLKDAAPAERTSRLAPFRRESEQMGLEVLSEPQRKKLNELRLAAQKNLSAGQAPEQAPLQKAPDEPPQRGVPAEKTPPRTGSASHAQAASDSPAPAGDESDDLLHFTFQFQPWSQVIDWFAREADLSLVMDAPPPGTFNYQDNRGYTPAEAIDLLNSVLLTKGYTLIRRDRMLMVINLEDGIPPNLVPRIELDELEDRGEFELVSVLFPLEKMTADDAEQELSKLLGPQGSIVKLAKSQQIMVTETAGRLRTIRSVLEEIENPGGGGLRIFELQYITLNSAMSTLRQLLDIPADGTATSDGAVRIAMQPAGNKLLVSGQADKVARVAEILKAIDIPGAVGAGMLAETPQFEMHPISSADPASVLAVLQTLMVNMPDVRLATDPKTGHLMALARPSQHAMIRATIAQMQSEGSKLEVIRLSRVDPQLAVLAINKLFGADTGAQSNAPKVDAEPVTRQLLVRGSEAQIAQIRALLEKMGEGESSADSVASGGNVRMLPLTGRAARTGLAQLEQIWPTMYGNKIRVVTPSAVAPTLRSGGDADTGRRQDLLRGLDPIRTPPAASPPDARSQQEPDRRRRDPDRRDDRDRRDESDDEETTGRTAHHERFHLAQQTRLVADDGPTADHEATSSDDLAPDEADALPDELDPESNQAEDQAATPEAGDPEAGDGHGDGDESTGDESTGERAPDESLSDQDAQDQPPAPIIVAPGPGGVMIASEDVDALNAFESLLSELASNTVSSGKEFTIFYLKSATAAVAAETLGNILGGGSVSRSGSGGSLLGNIAGAALGEGGGGMMGALLGMGGGESAGAIVARGSILIVPDHRLNALVVEASPNDLDTIEQLLEVLDQEGVPETLVASKPRMIPVIHTRASEIAAVIREVYQDRLISASGGNQRQPSPEDFIRMLRGGRGGRGGAGGGGDIGGAAEPEKMAIGVDDRTNSIVISASQPLFEEVEQLVRTLDQVTENTTQSVKVVTLNRMNTQAMQQALQAIVGGTSQTGGSNNNNRDDRNRGDDDNDRDRRRSDNREQMEQIRQRMEWFNNWQQRGGRGGRGRDRD